MIISSVYLRHTSHNGTSWSPVNSGLTNMIVQSLAVSGTGLFAGTYGGVWRRPLSDMITSVEKIMSNLPMDFILSQNYPNPFNTEPILSRGNAFGEIK